MTTTKANPGTDAQQAATTTASTPYIAPDRFAVSHEGMKELHADREPWRLCKELIQNVWDEAPEATRCLVTIKPGPQPNTLKVIVEDDGPGFSDPTDAYTLMRPTPKRLDPGKRGRFNLGEKEIISVAIEAEIETVGRSILFPAMGGRAVSPNDRTRGTKVSLLMPWAEDLAPELCTQLRKFRPTECGLRINNVEVRKREPVLTWKATLRTVLQSAPGQPLRESRRATELHLLPPANAGEAWLYELGIPIQQITTPWDVDVMQKVPMPPNRDTVGDSYLQDIYAEVLNAGYGLLEGDDFAAPWVDFAIDDDRSVAPAIQATVKGRYGDQPILSGPDRDANMKAAENGHTVIHPNSLTPKERQRFKQEAKVPTAREVYGIVRTFDPRHPKFIIPLSERPELPAFEAWVKELAGYCGLKAQVVFYEHQDGHYASCTADTKNPTVHFNCANLGKDFFKKPLNRPEQLALVIHELAHALSDKPMEHGPSWGEAAAQAGAKISAGLLAQAMPETKNPVIE